jgi:mannose-6-phosphate isomerase
LRTHLVGWLTQSAYPRWAEQGVDPRNGGFVEALDQNGGALVAPRRARVHPRQIYAFAAAPRFGWPGDVVRIVDAGLRYFTSYYRRADGLFRTLADHAGASLDDRALLYDQAFALLGLAAASRALDARAECERRALELRAQIERRFGTSDGVFRSCAESDGDRESNPHMHLLEACLGWAEIGADGGWADWVRRLIHLGLNRFIRADNGAIGEAFLPSGQPADGLPGRLIEPGHQFEWAWLLLRGEALYPVSLRETARRLIAIGNEAGVRNQVAVNAMLEDFSIHDPNARLWPQTERLKAALLAARLTGEAHYWRMAQAAASSFLPYLRTAVAGVWFDVQLPSGEMLDSPAPASTLYHLVGALAELDQAVAEPFSAQR